MKLSNYITDNAVFQQDKNIAIWGTARHGSKIKARLYGKCYDCSAQVVAQNENFKIMLPSAHGGYNTYTLVVTCGEEDIVIHNILIGDVYIAAGQSNMAYPVSAMENSAEILAQASSEQYLRVFYPDDAFFVDGRLSRPSVMQSDFLCGKGFREFTDLEAVKNMSGIAAMFALLLKKKIDMPIAIINVAVGGSSIDSWIAKDAINSCDEVREYMKGNELYYFDDDTLANKNRAFTLASGLFNEKISPLKNISVKGVIWYQGESSAWNFVTGQYYLNAYKLLIKSYREYFCDSSLPFIACNIAPLFYPYGIMGACYINEALILASLTEKNVFTAPIYDIEPRFNNKNGDTYYTPIHTTNKKPVAERFVTLAQNLYNNPINFPIIKSIEKREDCIIAYTTATQLCSHKLYGFTISDETGNYYQAKAKILAKNTIMVYNSNITHPQNISYAFFPINSECDFTDENGLSLVPYRSEYVNADDWYIPKPFLACNIQSVFSNNFDTFYDRNCREDVWGYSSINGSKDCNICFSEATNNKVTLSYIPNSDTMFLVGLSPKADFAGIPLQLDKFKKLSFCIESQNECDFLGLFFRTTKGVGYRFCAIVDDNCIGRVNLKKGENQITLDLTKVFRCDEGLVASTKELLENIYSLQFTFQDKQKGIISISSIELY